MANQGLSQVLPYKFRNTGSKPGSVTNILQAPPLEILERKILLSTKLTAVITRSDSESEVIQTNTQKLNDYPEILQLLEGKSADKMLWEIGIWAGHIEFNFRDKAQRLVRPDSKAVTSKVSIDANLGISFRILAPSFEKEPERQIFCEYGEDAAWGKSLRLVEYESGRGVQEAMFYPKAKKGCFEKLIHA